MTNQMTADDRAGAHSRLPELEASLAELQAAMAELLSPAVIAAGTAPAGSPAPAIDTEAAQAAVTRAAALLRALDSRLAPQPTDEKGTPANG